MSCGPSHAGKGDQGEGEDRKITEEKAPVQDESDQDEGLVLRVTLPEMELMIRAAAAAKKCRGKGSVMRERERREREKRENSD